jgi:Holliday junction resolvase-like predicted endonuclease
MTQVSESRQRLEGEIAFLRDEIRRLRRSLDLLTPGIDVLLKRRGFRIYKKEPGEDLLLPGPEFLDEYYTMLHKYSFRLFLRDVIKHQTGFTIEQVAKYATPRVTREYVEQLLRMGLAERRTVRYALVKRPVKSFGETLEWYIAEIFKREFATEAVWGVKFRRPKVGGDYDVIVKFDGSLVYVEVKSSPPKQIYDSEVAAFLDRVEDLTPAVAIFFMDTELRMKDKLVPMFEAALANRSADPPPVLRLERELFHVQGRVFIVNAKESVVQNLEKVISWHYRTQAGGR